MVNIVPVVACSCPSIKHSSVISKHWVDNKVIDND